VGPPGTTAEDGPTGCLPLCRVRVVDAVPIGETVEVHYRVSGSDQAKSLVHSTATITNEAGDTVLAGVHLTKVRSFQPA
jgi:hypothetical protein